MTEPASSPPRPPRLAALADWHSFGARRYRAFRLLAVAQGFIGPLAGPAIVIPLLLSLGAHPALATLLAVLPVLGTMGQRFLPRLLDRTDGNLRGLVVTAATIAEPRGLLLAGVIALNATGLISNEWAIAGVAVIIGTLGSLAAIAYGALQSWYQIILPDAERRLIGPRLAGIALGIGSVVLLPLAFGMDDLVGGIGVWAYAIPFGVSGVVGLIPAFGLRRLPSPGRVHVPRSAPWAQSEDGRLQRLARVITLASLAGGLAPFLSVYAIAVLGTGPGFAIALSATSSAALVLASLVVSSRLARGSASRLLRASMLLRAGALLLGLAAHPANPLAGVLLLLIAVALAAGDTAGQLSANERLYRLALGPAVIAFQSHFVVRNVLAYGGGTLTGSAVMLFGGYPAFAVLFAGAGLVRLVAARVTEISPVDRVGSGTGVHPAVDDTHPP
ncbi:MAG TPA: hypothetical protein VJA85_06730 [Candidatus Limnocylindria bacterium]|nr:hypothetical protein [Candidatus Limnocylindria bacterium]